MSTPFDQRQFDTFVIEHEVVGMSQDPILFSSGRTCHYYVNWRRVTNNAELLLQMTEFIISHVVSKGIRVDCYYGVPEGGTKLGISTQLTWVSQNKEHMDEMVVAMGRKTPKDHGDPDDRYFIGKPEGHVVVIEDVVTTGSSLLQEIDRLLSCGVNVSACVVLTDRNERREDARKVENILQEKGIKYLPLSSVRTLLPKINIDDLQRKEILNYWKKYGEGVLDI